MKNYATELAGKNERFLADICRYFNASLVVDRNGPNSPVKATMSLSRVNADSSQLNCEICSAPKPTREEACFSVIRQLLFPEVAAAVGVPSASSADELRLKLEVAGSL